MFDPPLATLASMKLNTAVATFVLVAAAVTVKTGPITDFPKTDTAIGPVVTPYGTIVVISVEVALTTRAGIPLNCTATFCKWESKFSPSMVTTVVGGPLNGVTCVMAAGNASYVNARETTPHVPSEFITTTFWGPGEFCGVFASMVPALTI